MFATNVVASFYYCEFQMLSQLSSNEIQRRMNFACDGCFVATIGDYCGNREDPVALSAFAHHYSVEHYFLTMSYEIAKFLSSSGENALFRLHFQLSCVGCYCRKCHCFS